MVQANHFSGLTMSVFSAFGWAGEETAMNFALDQLQLFIDALYYSLPREMQALFPVHGIDKGSQIAYLAINEEPEKDLYIAFFVRPMNFETSLIFTDKSALSKAYRKAKLQSADFFRLLEELGPEWNLRIQQMQFDEETGETTHYKDLYKNPAKLLEGEIATEITERADYLNSEDQWVVPIYISQRIASEKVAAMGRAVTDSVSQYIAALMPIASFLTGQVRKKKSKKRQPVKANAQPVVQVEDTTIRQPLDSAQLGKFTYVSELKPLHIRRGFINLTPNHWPFFALTARTETRPVIVTYGDQTDEGCAVWRLVPNDQARLVLSTPVHMWLEENFDADDRVQVAATKQDQKQIRISLAAA
ncbi:MAG: hypothetical protein WA996_16745 [Candidatus Promineifilaceae bacterium]